MDDERILERTNNQGFDEYDKSVCNIKAFECDKIGDGDNVSGPQTTR